MELSDILNNPWLVHITGRLAKLTFTAYKDAAFTERDKEAGEYSVMFNPTTLSLGLQVERQSSQAPGTTSSEMKFVGIKPQDYTFEFVIDGTGATGEKKDVADEVAKFLKVVYEYNGDRRQPNFVMIRYGVVLLKCVLKAGSITYNLFSPSGRPLRAKVSTKFSSALDQPLSEMMNNRGATEMMLKRVLKPGEALITAVQEIYKTGAALIEVARANDLDNFRVLPDGSELSFPPLNLMK